MDFLLVTVLSFGIFVGYNTQPAAGYNQCPVNEHYVNCINYCNTCWDNGECRSHYCSPGCDCKPGFYRNYYGQCVIAEECYAPFFDPSYSSFRGYCGENEIYTDCVNMCNDCISRGMCSFQYYCEPGCDCKLGSFRNERGICVPEQFCFRKRPICPLDEQYYTCIPTCRATCDTYSAPRAICDTTCTPGCFCKGGLIRRNDGKCVLPRDCPARIPNCPSGEAFYQCLPTCRITCETLRTSGRICSTECRPGCFCQPGFVRNRNGRCVRPTECPDNTTPGNISFDPRRGETNDEGFTGLTETTPAMTTENHQSVTDKPTQNDSPSTSSSVPVTTMLITSTIMNQASAGTNPVTPATELASPATDAITNATCGDACVMTTPQTPTKGENITPKESFTIPSGNTQAGVTSLVIPVTETFKTDTNDDIITTSNSLTDATNTEK